MQTICFVNNQEIKKNQDMVIDELINSEIINITFNKLNSDEILKILSDDCQIHSSNSQYLKKEKKFFIAFHLNLVKLLICCTIGKNAFTESKCQSYLKLINIEKVIKSINCPIELKEIYVKFLYHCYLNTENELNEVFLHSSIWSIFESFIKDINFLLSIKQSTEKHFEMLYSNVELQSYVANNIVDVVCEFFSSSQLKNIYISQVIIFKFNKGL